MTVLRLSQILLLVLLTAGFVGAADEEGRVVLQAEEQFSTENTWHGSGSVTVIYQNITIRCDEIEFDRTTGDLIAHGNITVDRGPSRFTADELHFNLNTKTGTFFNATAQIDPMYSFTGQKIEKIDETHYRIDRATFTTCETDGRPPWSFNIRKAKVEEEGYGYFSSTAMKVQGVPVFYLPYLVWPMKMDRAPGLLFPRLGYSDRRGFNFGLPFYLPIGRSYDTTIFADYYTKGYFGIGNQWRWAPVEGAAGEINLYAIWDRAAEELQWKINGFHRQDDFLGFRLQAEVENLSDIDFFQDFDRSFSANTRRSLYSYLLLTRSVGPYSLNLRTDHRTTFLNSGDVIFSQLPEVELRSGSTSLFGSPLYLNLISSLSYLRSDRGGDIKGTYGRADLFPTVSYTLPGPPWFSITPRLGGRATYYTQQLSEDKLSFIEEPLSRLYVTGAVDIVGPSISRVFEGGIGPYEKLKHLVEPRFEYQYLTTTTDVLRIPNFDEVDNTPRDASLLRMVLANRLLGRGGEGVGSRELASLEFFQDYSFDVPLNSSSATETEPARTSQMGPLGMALRLTPIPGTGFDGRLTFDTLHKNLSSTSLAASVQRPFGMLNLTWYASNDPKTGERRSSQIRSLISFRKAGFPLDASVQLAYDIHKAMLQDQRYQIGYQGSCWNVSAQYRDTRLGQFPTREFLIVFGLKGVGVLPEIKGNLGGY